MSCPGCDDPTNTSICANCASSLLAAGYKLPPADTVLGDSEKRRIASNVHKATGGTIGRPDYTSEEAQLDKEIEVYETLRADLEANHLHKWVVIHALRLEGIFESFEAAAESAVERFGRGPYLIRQVGAAQPPFPIIARLSGQLVKRFDELEAENKRLKAIIEHRGLGSEWQACPACFVVRTNFIQWLEAKFEVSNLSVDEFKARIEKVLSEAQRLSAALLACGTDSVNRDTCAVCHEHFVDCEEELFYHDDAPGSPAYYACPGAGARKALAGLSNVAPGRE